MGFDDDSDYYEQKAKEFVSKIKVGSMFRQNTPKYKDYLYHVLAIVDEIYIVVKYYGKHKQWWHYEVIDAFVLQLDYELGRIIIK